jgi:phenylacetate-CoA ligase
VAELLDFATRNVPFYYEFRGGKLADFPVLTKDMIRRESERLRSTDLARRQWHYETSGGSTGEPVQFIQDNEFLARTASAVLQSKRWTGYRPGDRLLKLWGNRQALAHKPVGFKGRAHSWLANTILLDTFRLDDQLMDEYIRFIRHWSPRLVVGYASSLYAISQRILQHHAPLSGIGAVVSTAGTLFPEHRDAMQSAFGCRVYNRYGSSEVSIIAAEDGTQHGLRILPTVFVETLNAAELPCSENESGEILVTSLANFAMPLIRFRIGDVGILAHRNECDYLAQVLGRSVEMFRTPSGHLIDGQLFIQAMYFRDWIKQFRIRQVALDHMVIEFVAHSAPVLSQMNEIESTISDVMGSGTTVDWVQVCDIPSLPSGKFLYTVCEVP